ncbi:hypothetical protein FM037_13550 [Shewanella psychropiezotolerans]|uniref:Uncharacterized protein n=1 Tax=Shewanella psychropiezotolerans TaxID=2593655 RepID=A0ABX5WY87_9GAMM|nr:MULTISPECIES: hypothetical protein [Shewanella]MPY23767.1 hypothetical protein [Shewanella sp. YLB-07]QDO84070.1 hypothetical protein FM037_13550 [Shewanella psychropiezotolerans]
MKKDLVNDFIDQKRRLGSLPDGATIQQHVEREQQVLKLAEKLLIAHPELLEPDGCGLPSHT